MGEDKNGDKLELQTLLSGDGDEDEDEDKQNIVREKEKEPTAFGNLHVIITRLCCSV